MLIAAATGIVLSLQSGNGDCMLAFNAPARAATFCILVSKRLL